MKLSVRIAINTKGKRDGSNQTKNSQQSDMNNPKLLQVFALIRLNHRVAIGLCGGVGGQPGSECSYAIYSPKRCALWDFCEALMIPAHPPKGEAYKPCLSLTAPANPQPALKTFLKHGFHFHCPQHFHTRLLYLLLHNKHYSFFPY